MTNIERLGLEGTKVTDSGIRRLTGCATSRRFASAERW